MSMMDVTLESTVHGPKTPNKSKALTKSVNNNFSKNERLKEAEKVYGRGRKVPLGDIRDKKLRRKLKVIEEKYKTATLQAKDAEILHENEAGLLEPENELERTYKVRQDEIQAEIAVETAKKKI